MTWTSRIIVLLGVFALMSFVPASARAERQEELRERFKNRLPEIRDAKAAGKIGETTAGMVEAVDAKFLEDKKLKSLVDDENSDRRELYKLIAEKEKTTEEKVAERNAKRNFEKAKPGDYLKDQDGKWKKKT